MLQGLSVSAVTELRLSRGQVGGLSGIRCLQVRLASLGQGTATELFPFEHGDRACC